MTKRIRDKNPFGLRMPDDIEEWVAEQAVIQDRPKTWIIINILKKEKALSAGTPRALDCNPSTEI